MTGPGAVLAQRYRLDQRVGGGAMGEVWRGTDTALDRTIAVKVVRPELLEEPSFRDRFLAEARTMAKIKHRGVVTVHDYHSDPSLSFLVMEYVAGESLAQRLYRLGRLDPVPAMTLLAQAADALQAAHDQGVVHRDVKPGNLLVTVDGTVVLTDFGIARTVASAPLTETGAVVGTVSYLAPEQVLGKPATARSDVYALGVVAYECLTGRKPFEGENPFEIAMKRVQDPPQPLPEGFAPAVRTVVEQALAAEPEQRWESAAEFGRAARRAASAVPVAGTAAVRAAVPAPGGEPPPSPPPPHYQPPAQQQSPFPPPAQQPPYYQAPPVHQPPYQPPAYPSAGYQAPAQSPYPPPRPVPGQQNTLGLLGLIFGILSIPFGVCCGLFGTPAAVAGIVLGVLGMRKAAEGLASNRGMALAGVICGGVGAVLAVVSFGLSLVTEVTGL